MPRYDHSHSSDNHLFFPVLAGLLLVLTFGILLLSKKHDRAQKHPSPHFAVASTENTTRKASTEKKQCEQVRNIPLITPGKALATIVIADAPVRIPISIGNTHQTVRYAAVELQHFIRMTTGCKLVIKPASRAPAAGMLILVGESLITRKLGLKPPEEPEGFRIVAFDRGAAILGETAAKGTNGVQDPIDRGTLHGVYEFLERRMGCRFYYHNDKDETFGYVLPQHEQLSIPADFDLSLAPDFLHRKGGVLYPGNTRKPHCWQRCLRSGSSTGFHANHTDEQWYLLFRKDHPEWFMHHEDGTIDKKHLNYLHPGILQQRLAIIEDFYRNGSWKGGWIRPNRKYIPFVPTDLWMQASRTATDIKAAQRRNCRARGIHSDIIFGHGAKLARAVQKRWPGRRVAMLAYENYMYPPSFAIPHNLDVMVCLMRSGLLNKEADVWNYNLQLINEWSVRLEHKRKRLYIWDYPCWPKFWTSAPIICPHELQRWLQAVHGRVAGYFINYGGWNSAMGHYFNWIWHRLLWNVNADTDALLHDYCTHFFGPAAKPMERFYITQINRYENVKWGFRRHTSYVPPEYWYNKTYTPEVIAGLRKNLDDALSLCCTDEKDLYHRRVLWMQKGYAGFFQEATLAHKWLNTVPRYKVASIITPPKTMDAWRNTQATELVAGNYGAPAEPRTIIRMLRHHNLVYVRFEGEEPGNLLASRDRLILEVKLHPKTPLRTLVVTPDGLTSNNMQATLVINRFRRNSWLVLLSFPISSLRLKTHEGGTRMLQIHRIRMPRKSEKIPRRDRRGKIIKPKPDHFYWMPQMAPPWLKDTHRWGRMIIMPEKSGKQADK